MFRFGLGLETINWNPNGANGGGSSQPVTDHAPGVDIPADPSQDSHSTDPGFSYIDEATNQMLADDMPEGQPQAPQRQAPQPQYPQPVLPQRRQAAPGQAPQQFQQQAQPQRQQAQAQPQAQPQAPADPAAERARNDPFGYQAEMIAQQEQNFVQALANETYKLSDQDMDAFLSGDSSKVSLAMARVHVNAVSSVMRMVSQHMPIWVGNMLKVHQASTRAEDSFWQSAPYLDRAQHSEMAYAAARAIRQTNPGIDTASMGRMVAAMVAAAVGISPTAGPGAQPQFQTAAGVRTPGRVVRNTGSAFQPAGMQAVSGARPAPIDNPWAATAEILRADEQGLFDGQLS